MVAVVTMVLMHGQHTTSMISTFARITNILQDGLLACAYKADNREQALVDMWQQFEKLSSFCPIPSRDKK